MKFPRSYEATTTREDFVRLLSRATGGEAYREIDGRFCGHDWSIHLTRIAPLEIGLVCLERHRVDIEFSGLSAEEQERFMLRFTQHYQRGGG
ncbi:MAG: hypothetical protein M0Z99_17315 [Betaproteobacteria bacterium]|nr:hypothetical protein [Betaproteobacteria bacterium]